MSGPLFNLIGALLLLIPGLVLGIIACLPKDKDARNDVLIATGFAFVVALCFVVAAWIYYAYSLGGFPK